MKKILFFFIGIFFYVVGVSNCTTTRPPKTVDPDVGSSIIEDDCDFVTSRWQKETRNLSNSGKLARIDSLAIYADAEIEELKNMSTSGKVSFNKGSELLNNFNQIIKQESTLSDDFWEVEKAYVGTLCFLRSMLESTKKRDKKFRSELQSRIIDWTENRRQLVFEKKRILSDKNR